MADKQATIYIVDQGLTTGECHNGRVETDLDYAMRYVWDKLTTTTASGRKTWSAGVLGLRTEETNVPLPDSEGYEHISVQKELGPMEMSHLRSLQRDIKTHDNDAGDAISAIALAVDIINKYTSNAKGQPLKFERKIVLVTDGQGEMETEAEFMKGLSAEINESKITLVVLGVDFDDPEYGFKEEDKDIRKAQNETALRRLVDACEGSIFGTMVEAIEDMTIPRLKTSRPYCTYKGQLNLGDPSKYETAIAIDVERYFRTKAARPPTASSFVTRSEFTSTQSTNTLPGDTEMADGPPGGELAVVRTSRTYKVKEETSAGGWKEVEAEELEKGYAYGSTAVHIAASDENVTKLETLQGFSIIGFIPMNNYERFLNMGPSCVTIAQQTNDKARLALSSLIHALHEWQSYAVARLVPKEGKDPVILLLAPSIEPHLESLIDVPLPFAEDVRAYRFPPLDRVITTSGDILKTHRNLPTNELKDAMSDYVDSMDLSTFGRDDEGQPTEYMTIEETYSPMIHRLDQAIRRRAIQPEEDVAPPADILLKWTGPPDELVQESASYLQKLVQAADVKRVAPKVKGKRRKEHVAPLSGLDIDSLLGREKRQRISAENAIPEFKQLLASSDSDEVLEGAIDQMASIVRTLITKSTGDSNDDRVSENMKIMRKESIAFDLVEKYNDFVSDLKSRLVKGDLGGDRREFWYKIVRGHKLGLIDKATTSTSTVSEDEVRQFYSIKSELPTRNK
ncbi:ku family dna [Phlyctema vagabunda]|uniref:ATP-dependent DNA helicase II subunit 2 n=1 Tax=Phlyctema vagabunda TaxID=108571 RepID=A0ABR4PJZ3_9HELO